MFSKHRQNKKTKNILLVEQSLLGLNMPYSKLYDNSVTLLFDYINDLPYSINLPYCRVDYGKCYTLCIPRFSITGYLMLLCHHIHITLSSV